jgi:hypothetical protein
MQPLDTGFNIAVRTIAECLCPSYRVSDYAPDTYEKLKAHLDLTKCMVVWSGASESTIYACPEANWAFRAWHDWCHYTGRHEFTPGGERAVFEMQKLHLLLLYGDCATTRRWIDILRAEVIGQQEYFYEHGHYPEDQRAFVEAELRKSYPCSQAAE